MKVLAKADLVAEITRKILPKLKVQQLIDIMVDQTPERLPLPVAIGGRILRADRTRSATSECNSLLKEVLKTSSIELRIQTPVELKKESALLWVPTKVTLEKERVHVELEQASSKEVPAALRPSPITRFLDELPVREQWSILDDIMVQQSS